MKKLAFAVAAVLTLAPTIASATYMCDKRFAEVYGTNCPSGSSWTAARTPASSTAAKPLRVGRPARPTCLPGALWPIYPSSERFFLSLFHD